MPKILIVEDNEMNRDMLSRRLVKKGYDVTVALDGLEGVAAAASQRPDLILMDVGLPGIDGHEAIRRIRAQPDLARIPIIALTAHAMSDDRAKAIEAGCDDYDTKPVDLPRLLGKVEAQKVRMPTILGIARTEVGPMDYVSNRYGIEFVIGLVLREQLKYALVEHIACRQDPLLVVEVCDCA